MTRIVGSTATGRRLRRSALRRLLLVGLLVLVVAACGDDEPAAVGSDAAAGEDASANVGGDLAVPDWFPSPFTLPEGMRVTETFQEPDNQRAGLYGVVDDGDAAAIVETLATGLPADGFERMTDGTDPLVFIKDGVGRVRIFVGELETPDGPAVDVRVDIDTWTDEQLDELRTTVAEPVETTGRATATIDGTTYAAEGECIIGGRSFSFVSPGDPTVSVSVDQSTDPPTVYADVYVSGDDTVLFVPATDGAMTGSVDSATPPFAFSAAGPVVEQNSGDGPFDAVFGAVCDE